MTLYGMKHFKNLPNVNVTGSSPSTSASWSGSDNVFSGEAFGASKVGLILFDSGDADGFLKNQNLTHNFGIIHKYIVYVVKMESGWFLWLKHLKSNM